MKDIEMTTDTTSRHKKHLRATSEPSLAGLPVLALLAVTGGAQADTTGGTFFEDFATLDLETWYISDGWSNGDHQNCLWSKSAVSQDDGKLQLYFQQEDSADHDYACGELQSRKRFGYGTYEARFKTDEGSGLNAAFFTYIGPTHDERHDEIDVEILLRNTHEVTVNTFVDGQQHHGAVAPIDTPTDEAFHIYSFIWEEGRMRWYVNGRLIHTAEDPVMPERPQKIFLTIWGSDTLTEWMGPFSPPDEPKLMEVDWVAYTAPGDPCQFDESILCTLAKEEE
jgi:endo-1,3-1,4-beta-glycanase ExoK